ncbi:iron(III) dicitrate transport system, ATP-binding protein [Escherichia coli]|uniref:Iron(III) dicitrate transport system, ATP-binding protein n=1 Tax=Escherichia coli TaxID=562 RepID=A0A376YF43_ECOLX|nr:iron(III) dicitrate transport system, ATP-binding protein [Escherichia coli]
MTLRTENLTVSYGTDKVLNDVSLSLPTGKITALIGPNGCGKSTLLNCFSRLLMPQSGTVFLGDNPINMLSSRQLAPQAFAAASAPFNARGDHSPGAGFVWS